MKRTWTIREHRLAIALVAEDRELSLARIAAILGRSRSSVASHLRRHGIKTNAPNGAPWGNRNAATGRQTKEAKRLSGRLRTRRWRMRKKANNKNNENNTVLDETPTKTQ